MSDAYARYQERLDNYERALPVPTKAYGAIFLVGGRVSGMELFGSYEILAKVWPKILCSYTMQALTEGKSSTDEATECESVDTFIERLGACQVETHKGVGLGTDLRLDSEKVVGGGLFLDQDVVHLYAFPQTPTI